MVSVGFLFLIQPTLEMWKRHVYSEVSKDEQPEWLRKGVRIADLVLLAAIITAVVGASEMSSGDMDLARTMKRVSCALSLAIVGITLLGSIYTHVHFGLRIRPTLVLVVLSLLCLVVAVFRIVQAFSTDPTDASHSRAAFYILQITIEAIAVSIILAMNINAVFPPEEAKSDAESETYPAIVRPPQYEMRTNGAYDQVHTQHYKQESV